jgi:hypothetical protein
LSSENRERLLPSSTLAREGKKLFCVQGGNFCRCHFPPALDYLAALCCVQSRRGQFRASAEFCVFSAHSRGILIGFGVMTTCFGSVGRAVRSANLRRAKRCTNWCDQNRYHRDEREENRLWIPLQQWLRAFHLSISTLRCCVDAVNRERDSSRSFSLRGPRSRRSHRLFRQRNGTRR